MTEVIEVEPIEETTDIVSYTPEITYTPEQIKGVLENTYAVLGEFMRAGTDYMEIRGKKSLTQAGGERLLRFFSLGEDTICLKEVERWPEGDDKGFLYYHYLCRVHKLGFNVVVATGEGTANSQEAKYKSQSVYDLVHTLRSMARKRAFTAAVRRATGTSEFWSDSLEDLPPEMSGGDKPQPQPQPQAKPKPIPTPMTGGFDDMEPQSPEDTVLPWGKKHNNETLGQIMSEDPAYLKWLHTALAKKEADGELPDDQVSLKSAVDLLVENL